MLLQLNLDGTVRVTHPDFSDCVYPLHRLTRLYDGLEQLENDLMSVSEEDGGTLEVQHPWTGVQWEDTVEEDMVQDGLSEGQETGGDDINMGTIEKSVISEYMSVASQDHDGDEDPWIPFKILSSAPVDHAFYTSPPARPSKLFLSRLRKEYTVLDSSLPGQCIMPLDKLSLTESKKMLSSFVHMKIERTC